MVGAESDDPKVRSSVLDVLSYDLLVDLTGAGEAFSSLAELRFRCRHEGVSVFADLQAVEVRRVVLNGADVTSGHLNRDGRLELPQLAGENRLIVEAEFAYVETGSGLYRVRDVEAGFGCVYSKSSCGGATRIFCCFDQPDLRAPITLNVRCPAGWCCRANFPAVTRPRDGEAGVWRFAPTPPLAPYMLAFCAGSDHGTVATTVVDGVRPIPLTVWTPAAGGQPVGANTLAELVRRPLRYYANALGIDYPYPKCDLVFVPRFPALAFSPPGLRVNQGSLSNPASGNVGKPARLVSGVRHRPRTRAHLVRRSARHALRARHVAPRGLGHLPQPDSTARNPTRQHTVDVGHLPIAT